MNYTILFIITYIVIYLGLLLCDAFIGLPVDFDGHERPPLFLMAMVWPLTILVCLIIAFLDKLYIIKERRLEKEKQQKNIRIKLEKENEKYLDQIDEELKIYNKNYK